MFRVVFAVEDIVLVSLGLVFFVVYYKCVFGRGIFLEFLLVGLEMVLISSRRCLDDVLVRLFVFF